MAEPSAASVNPPKPRNPSRLWNFRRSSPKTLIERMARAFDQPGMGFLALDPASFDIHVRSNLSGLLPSLGATLGSALQEESAARLERMLRDAQTGAPQAPAILRTKEQLHLECSLLPKGDQSSLIPLLLRDVTSQHRHQQMMENENEALKTDVRRYSLILNSAEELVWLRNDALDIVYCNLVYSQLVDEVSDTATGIPELHTQARKLAEAAKKEGKAQREKRHLVVNGQRRLFKIREAPMPGGGVIGFARDMTDVEEAQQEVDRHISAQADFLDSSTSAIAIFGKDMRLRFYNSAYVALWKMDEIWLDSQPLFSAVLEHLREKRRLPEQANFKAFKEQSVRQFTDLIDPHEDFYYLPDGRTLRMVVIPHATGGLMYVYEDVTDRLALERSYNTLIAVQKETLDNLHEGVVVFGEDGRLRLYNPVFSTLWQLDVASLPDQIHVNELLERVRHLFRTPAEEWDNYKRSFVSRVQSRSLFATRLDRSDNSVLSMTIVPLPDGGTLLTFTDITDSTLVERSLREKNDALQAADRLKTEFLANVSYELRSPLTSISGFSEMLRQKYFGDLTERQREYVEGIHDSSQQLMHLINDILDLASIEAGYMTLDIREVDILQMLKNVMSLINERMKKFSIRAVLDCASDIGAMKADETRLRQVLFNLLSNAIKYSPEAGVVTLGASRDADSVRLYVSDQGPGIEQEEQQAIFEKFYRGNTRLSMSGTGLGLSMVKNFIEMHGGHVLLDSEPGRGTTIICVLPQTVDAPKETHPDERQSLPA